MQRDISHGLPDQRAGLGFFTTSFKLDIPEGFDVPMSFIFKDTEENEPYRALLFINGWMMGKRIANLGPQFIFPVHQGILNYQGEKYVVKCSILISGHEN